ncbi:Protein asteroid 1 [Desmophyllum pertusum]|uniref:Protein asteroid 1 n=1 Tax=Desmophyllum pertusum TaxID=174260 RepID=A0A9W9YQ24_9CNID|nr:Protein asteroid 1 [Desmophyllum pertusum]
MSTRSELFGKRSILQNTKLVIDGSSLCYYLYRLDCQCGGQYDEFYNTVLSFFDALISNGVESFVIFDGADDPSGKNEADTEIASLACAWDCPVLSNDSDFFIFDIKEGYIPLDTSTNWNSNPLTVKEEARFKSIANMLSELPDSSTEEQALNSALQMVSSPESRAQLRQAVELSLQEYTIKESNLLRYFQDGVICSSLRTQTNREIDEWVLRRFRDGRFSTKYMSSLTSGKFFLKIQVENCREISANRCSQWLRQFVYGILNDAATHEEEGNIAIVQEWDREGLTVRQSDVTPYHKEGVVPCLSHIQDWDAEMRLTSLLSALGCNTKHNPH